MKCPHAVCGFTYLYSVCLTWLSWAGSHSQKGNGRGNVNNQKWMRCMGKLPSRLDHDLSGLRCRDERIENSCAGRRGRFQGVKRRNTGGELRSTDTPGHALGIKTGVALPTPVLAVCQGRPGYGWWKEAQRGYRNSNLNKAEVLLRWEGS